jgi:hypothetical protein
VSQVDLPDFSAIPDPLAAHGSAQTPATSVAPAPPREAVGPTRSAVIRRRLAAVALGFGWLFLVQVVIGLRSGVPMWIMALHAGVPTALGAVALYLALRPGKVGVGPSARSVITFGVIGAATFSVAALATPCATQTMGYVEGSLLCGDITVLIAIVPLAAIAWAQRGTFVAGAGFRSALLGASVGFAAAGMQALHCIESDRYHVLFGHGWPVIALGLAAYLLLRKKLAVS